MGVTREDILAAYEWLLGRPPESEAALAAHLDCADRAALRERFLASEEFRAAQAQGGWLHRYAGFAPADLGVLRAFPRYAGEGKAGFVTNFLGVRVSCDFGTGLGALDGAVLPPPLPQGDHWYETAEWIGALRAVLAAEGRFRMLELGAGFGGWMANTGVAARLRGIPDIRVYGVEADAGHLGFLRRHLAENGFTAEQCFVLPGAVGAARGQARWAAAADPAGEYGGRPGEAGEPVEVYPLAELLAAEPLWDLVHVDIQGAEAEVCASAMPMLDARVRRVVLGTHGRVRDGECFALFHAAGWALEQEKPSVGTWAPGQPVDALVAVDGIQAWKNPRL